MCFELLLKAKPCPVEPVKLKRGVDKKKYIQTPNLRGEYCKEKLI